MPFMQWSPLEVGSMLYLLYVLLAIYSLPLLGLILSALLSDFFSSEIQIVYVVGAISNAFGKLLRDLFGNLFIALLSVYSVPLGSGKKKIPREKRGIFYFFIALLLLGILFYGVIVAFEGRIRNYGANTFTGFKEIALSYPREALTYIALTLGISLKMKGQA
jgi:hypothetical protein